MKSKADRDSEENLSLAHLRIRRARDLNGSAAVIVVQIYNRWPDALPYLKRLDKIHAMNLKYCDSAAERIGRELKANRTKPGNGTRKAK